MTGTDHTGKAGSGGELHMQAMAFPTPTAKDADGSRDTSMKPGSRRHKGRTLTDATSDLWPTPRTLTGGPESAERKLELGRGDGCGGDLQAAVENWPSPRSEDSESCGNHPGAQDSLSGVTKSWPTPVSNPEAPNLNSNQRDGCASLGAAAILWPSPSADGSAGEDSPDLERKGSKLVNKKTGRVLQTNLATEVKHWPTPNASLMNDGESPESFQKRADRLEEKHGNTNGAGTPLPVAAAAWPTPRADSKGGSRTPGGDPEKDGRILDQVAKEWATPTSSDLSTPRKQTNGGRSLMTDADSWPTPTSMDSEDAGKKGEKHGLNLPEASQNWPSPNSRDHKGSDLASRNGGASLSHFAETGERTHGSSPSSPQVPVMSVHGGELSPTDPSTASRRRLNPAFVCWLMGWPWWWTNPGEINSARQETESYLFRLRTLLRFLLRGQD